MIFRKLHQALSETRFNSYDSLASTLMAVGIVSMNLVDIAVMFTLAAGCFVLSYKGNQ